MYFIKIHLEIFVFNDLNPYITCRDFVNKQYTCLLIWLWPKQKLAQAAFSAQAPSLATDLPIQVDS